MQVPTLPHLHSELQSMDWHLRFTVNSLLALLVVLCIAIGQAVLGETNAATKCLNILKLLNGVRSSLETDYKHGLGRFVETLQLAVNLLANALF